MAAGKGNAGGGTIPKQFKAQDEVVRGKARKNPALVPSRNLVPVQTPIRLRSKQRRRKKVNTSKRTTIQDHVGDFDFFAELSNELSDVAFGQLVRCDA